MTKAIQKAQKSNLPAEIDFSQDEGLGLNNIGKDDLLIPMLIVLQALSPQVDEDNQEAFVKGAKPGMIYNTATGSIEKSITAIPVAYSRRYIERTPRTEKSRFVTDHGEDKSILDDCIKDENGRYILPEGNEICPTGTFYVLVISDEGIEQAVISLGKSQLRKSKKWVTMLSNERVPRPDGNGKYQPPMFYRSYDLTTVKESNEGNTWYGWALEKGKTLSELPDAGEIYQFAKSFHNDIAEGKVRVAEEPSETTGEESDGF